MKRFIIVIIIIGVATGLSWAGYQYSTQTVKPASLTDDPAIEIVPVQRETLVDMVNATGRIEPKAEVEMNFEIGGVVQAVLVEEGQAVTAGTPLARLDTYNLEFAVKQAEIDLAQQKAELDRLFEPELAEKIAAAQANIDSTRLALVDLQAGPDPDEVAKAEAELSLARETLKKAQWDYDEVAYLGEIGAMPQAKALQEATLNYEIAQANHNLAVKEPTAAELAAARATLANAEATVAELLESPSAAEIAARQALIDKAALSLAEKQRNLEQAVLLAPSDGLLVEINIEPGERVLSDAQTAAMILANTSAYLLKVEVDEIDIARIARGQSVSVELDAFVDRQLTGTVTDISPRPIQGDANAIVMYEATITLETGSADLNLLSGMTANAAIETGRLKDVVVVPNRAIQIDRTGPDPVIYVEKVGDDGQAVRAEVQLGLRNGTVTEVLSGLSDGDELVIRREPDTEATPNL